MKKGKKVLVSLAAWKALEMAVNSLPSPRPTLFVTGGPLADVELLTDYDWTLYHAAYALAKK